MLQFNFLKFYSSRDPNVRIGISAQNIGVSLTGFGDKIQLDDPLPSTVAAGISVKLVKPVTLSFDFVQPLNLFDIGTYLIPYFNSGVSIQFASFVSLLAGFSLKGANPRISTGLEFEVAKIRLNMNYTLDLTTSLAPLNRISLSAKILLGDKGRSITDAQVDEYYKLGLKYYADAQWEDAILVWEEALKLNRRFDPAIQGIQSARYQIEMFQMIQESLQLD
jgi:tetratricopeptide (TPR) repeat protein